MACAILPGCVWAGPAGSQGGDFIYKVEPDWRLLQSRNRVVDPYRLVPGSHIRMPLFRMPVTPAMVRAEGADVSQPAAFSVPQRIGLRAMLRDARGDVVLLGGTGRGVETGVC